MAHFPVVPGVLSLRMSAYVGAHTMACASNWKIRLSVHVLLKHTVIRATSVMSTAHCISKILL